MCVLTQLKSNKNSRLGAGAMTQWLGVLVSALPEDLGPYVTAMPGDLPPSSGLPGHHAKPYGLSCRQNIYKHKNK